MNFLKKAKTYAELIKLGHTLFALPFALSAVALAVLADYKITYLDFLWIVLAFASARSAAMGFNRIVDVKYDALNIRTKNRPTASGEIPLSDAKLFTTISIILFIGVAYLINPLCFFLSFPALVVLLGYSYAKRFTAAAHYILGIALSLAPIGAWIAVTGNLDTRILALGCCLFFHISGFDLVYSLQDREFDIAHNLHSVPSRFGVKATYILAGISFFLATFFLFLTGKIFALNYAYFACGTICAVLYLLGFITMLKCGLTKVNLVFFYTNVFITALIFIGVISNFLWK